MLVPVVADLGRSAKLAVSRIYMGVSNASVLGGSTTLIGTSTNLIVAGLVLTTYGVDLGVFFPTAVGLPAAIVGVALMLLLADRLLGRRTPDREAADAPKPRYRAEFVVADGSPLAGRTLARAGLAEPTGARLLGVTRAGETIADPPADWTLAAGDALAFDATIAAVGQLWTTLGLVAANPPRVEGDEYATRLVEGVVAVDSPYIGGPASELARAGRKVVAVSRGSAALAAPLAEEVVAAGDNVVLQMDAEEADERPDGLALTRRVSGYRVRRTDRAVAAMVIVAAMVLLSAFGVMSLVNAALLASGALIATGCLSFRAAIGAIDWETYVILACAVGLEPAVTNSGLADVIADMLSSLAGDSVVLGLAVVFVGTVVLTNLVTNSAAAALMFPIADGHRGLHGRALGAVRGGADARLLVRVHQPGGLPDPPHGHEAGRLHVRRLRQGRHRADGRAGRRRGGHSPPCCTASPAERPARAGMRRRGLGWRTRDRARITEGMMSESIDRSALPIAGCTGAGPGRPHRSSRSRPPAGAPNVLIVLLDDVGFSASSAFGGAIATPTAERLAAGGLKLSALPHDGDVRADPPGVAHRPQPPHGGHGRHHGARHVGARLQLRPAPVHAHRSRRSCA